MGFWENYIFSSCIINYQNNLTKEKHASFSFLLRKCECNDYFYDIKSTSRNQTFSTKNYWKHNFFYLYIRLRKSAKTFFWRKLFKLFKKKSQTLIQLVTDYKNEASGYSISKKIIVLIIPSVVLPFSISQMYQQFTLTFYNFFKNLR